MFCDSVFITVAFRKLSSVMAFAFEQQKMRANNILSLTAQPGLPICTHYFNRGSLKTEQL